MKRKSNVDNVELLRQKLERAAQLKPTIDGAENKAQKSDHSWHEMWLGVNMNAEINELGNNGSWSNSKQNDDVL